MPNRRLSKMKAMRGIEGACLEHAQTIYDSTVGKVLEEQGYTLKRVLDGWFDKSESDKIRKGLLEGRLEGYSGWRIEGTPTPALADFVVWHEKKDACVLIEAITGAVVQILDQDVMSEMERFAEAWEKERPAFIEKLETNFSKHLDVVGMTSGQFRETVTIIEAYIEADIEV